VVTVLKLLFFRDKDLADLAKLLKVRAKTLDRRWVRSQLVQICGPHDPRVAEWDELTRRFPATDVAGE
jgi:hypothetical protein